MTGNTAQQGFENVAPMIEASEVAIAYAQLMGARGIPQITKMAQETEKLTVENIGHFFEKVTGRDIKNAYNRIMKAKEECSSRPARSAIESLLLLSCVAKISTFGELADAIKKPEVTAEHLQDICKTAKQTPRRVLQQNFEKTL